MSKIVQFGENVAGYNIPVLNEREIRAGAGIMFLATFIALMRIIYEGNFLFIKFVIIIFMLDFFIRLFINPKFAPLLIVGRLFVSNQNPEYVGAEQKKFAWYIGLVLASTMFVLMVLMNTYSIITGLVCLLCLILLFSEAVFGICIGCTLYGIFYKQKAQYCPGEVCDIKNKQEIQKISKYQWLMILISVVFLFALSFLFLETLQIKPTELGK